MDARIKRKFLITVALACIVVIFVVYRETTAGGRGKLDYASSLDKVAAVVNGEELTLRKLAFYVAYEEALVQKQALIYDPGDTSRYWNVQIDKVFIRVQARNAAMQMAIHDVIFSDMADEDGVTLADEEEAKLLFEQTNFWQDLVEDEKVERLGVTKDDIFESMRRVALAEKYQSIYEQITGADEGDYDIEQAAYKELLSAQKYKVRKELWRRVPFGNVTLRHERRENRDDS
ncbi:MAG: hypothetical protein J1D89_01470 [Agathobacter sp.]|nr:hypothetical protein [Agathobacter sp.]